jgi:methionine synthase I (cobalamin-dependent)/5,10-methylenetetrahydrofolate reductase
MIKSILEAISDGGMVADGAMGSLLYERGVYAVRSFDEVNLNQPELVYKIHRDYLLSGAQMLETNTYGSNRIRLARHGLAEKTVEINEAAARNLKRAVEDNAYAVGAIGPTGLPPGDVRQSEDAVYKVFAEQAKALIDGGCDALSIETFSQPAELRLAVTAARSVTNRPIIAMVQPRDDMTIADGSNPAQLATEMRAWGADVVGANCNSPDVIYKVATAMLESKLPIAAMPNAGRPEHIEDRLIYLATPENFGVFAKRFFKAGIKLVGGCCGTNPNHIRRLAAAARMITPVRRATVQKIEFTERLPEIPIEKRSHFGSLLGKQFTISVEVNPASGLSTDKQSKAAKSILEAGADVINIADGPRATARMSNLSFAVKLKNELQNEVLLHVCCRDRNLLGLQASILGAHVLGLRNVILITGDPPKVGDYPDATAVYDLDSIGLIEMCKGFNRGLDPAGKFLGEQTSFVIATGAEPAALDFERELFRLEQKVDAGANLIMTQPVYDQTHFDRFLERTAHLHVPVFIGILPLASYRNAEFIHNHIPGMNIPDDIRERMRKAGKGDAARKEGVAIATEALMSYRDRVAGTYIMPPLGRYEMAEEIIEALGADRTLGKEASA